MAPDVGHQHLYLYFLSKDVGHQHPVAFHFSAKDAKEKGLEMLSEDQIEIGRWKK